MSTSPVAPSTPAIRRPTLLVVDDEEGPRQSLKIVFQDDYEVHVARNADEALEVMRAKRMDIAILDIRMAGISGIDLLEMLKSEDSRIEVIMLTAYETLETARQALRLGACDYLSKPFDLSTIREAAARALHLRNISDNIASTAQRLGDLTQQLHSATLKEDLARTTNEIYAGVLHDINNPLTIIAGYVELLQSRLSRVTVLHGKDLVKAREDVQTIARQVSTCTAIASRYLKSLRQTAVDSEPLSINQVLADLETLLKNHPATKQGTLNVRFLEEDKVPNLSGTELIQILLNLAINGLQSCPPDRRLVEIHCRLQSDPITPPTPDAATLVEGETGFKSAKTLIAIEVRDTGSGIAPGVLPSIFKPYFTTKGPQRGTGLGLAIVSRLVRTGHGLIVVKTNPGQGTSFTVYLPLRTDSAKVGT